MRDGAGTMIEYERPEIVDRLPVEGSLGGSDSPSE